MMRKISLSSLLALLVSTGFQCQPTKISSSLTGKLVIIGPCSHYIVQILEGSYGPGQADPSWKNTANDSVYENVFAVADPCDFGLNGLQQGDIFSFEWDQSGLVQTPNCAICQIFYPTPSKSNAVMNVKKIK